jgi:hypothetical protein
MTGGSPAPNDGEEGGGGVRPMAERREVRVVRGAIGLVWTAVRRGRRLGCGWSTGEAGGVEEERGGIGGGE